MMLYLPNDPVYLVVHRQRKAGDGALTDVQSGEHTSVTRAQATEVVHSIRGYLAHCQDQAILRWI